MHATRLVPFPYHRTTHPTSHRHTLFGCDPVPLEPLPRVFRSLRYPVVVRDGLQPDHRLDTTAVRADELPYRPALALPYDVESSVPLSSEPRTYRTRQPTSEIYRRSIPSTRRLPLLDVFLDPRFLALVYRRTRGISMLAPFLVPDELIHDINLPKVLDRVCKIHLTDLI